MSTKTRKPTAGLAAGLSLVLLASAALPAGPAAAADKPRPKKLTPNAALVYWQAFAMLPDLDAKAGPTPGWRTAKIDAKTRTFVSKAKQSLRLMHKAAAIDACDWGIDWSDGPGTLLPHLGKARRLTKLAMLRAKVRLADGQTDAALADATATLRLSRHVARGGMIIEMLVGMAVESGVLDLLAELLGKLTAEQKKALAGQFDRLPPGMDLSQAILAQKAAIVDWIVDQMRKRGRKALIETMGQDPVDMPWPLKGKTDAELLALLKDLGEKYVAISRAAALPGDQAGAKLAEIEKGFGKSSNPLVPILMPAVRKLFKHQTELLKQRKALRAKLSAR